MLGPGRETAPVLPGAEIRWALGRPTGRQGLPVYLAQERARLRPFWPFRPGLRARPGGRGRVYPPKGKTSPAWNVDRRPAGPARRGAFPAGGWLEGVHAKRGLPAWEGRGHRPAGRPACWTREHPGRVLLRPATGWRPAQIPARAGPRVRSVAAPGFPAEADPGEAAGILPARERESVRGRCGQRVCPGGSWAAVPPVRSGMRLRLAGADCRAGRERSAAVPWAWADLRSPVTANRHLASRAPVDRRRGWVSDLLERAGCSGTVARPPLSEPRRGAGVLAPRRGAGLTGDRRYCVLPACSDREARWARETPAGLPLEARREAARDAPTRGQVLAMRRSFRRAAGASAARLRHRCLLLRRHCVKAGWRAPPQNSALPRGVAARELVAFPGPAYAFVPPRWARRSRFSRCLRASHGGSAGSHQFWSARMRQARHR